MRLTASLCLLLLASGQHRRQAADVAAAGGAALVAGAHHPGGQAAGVEAVAARRVDGACAKARHGRPAADAALHHVARSLVAHGWHGGGSSLDLGGATLGQACACLGRELRQGGGARGLVQNRQGPRPCGDEGATGRGHLTLRKQGEQAGGVGLHVWRPATHACADDQAVPHGRVGWVVLEALVVVTSHLQQQTTIVQYPLRPATPYILCIDQAYTEGGGSASRHTRQPSTHTPPTPAGPLSQGGRLRLHA